MQKRVFAFYAFLMFKKIPTIFLYKKLTKTQATIRPMCS